MILIDRSVNAGIVGFRGSTQPTGGNPTSLDLSSSLMAANTEDELLVPFVNIPVVFNKFPIGESGVPTGNTLDIETNGTSQISNTHRTFIISDNTFQAGISHINSFESSISHIDSTKVSPFKVGVIDSFSVEGSSFQVSSSEITVGKNTGFERSSSQISTFKGNFDKSTTTEVNANQISSTEVSLNKLAVLEATSPRLDTTQIHTTQIDPFLKQNLNERSSSSLVTSQQFFSSHPTHDNTFLLTSIYSTAQSIWHSNTAIDLNFAITNLPTGQLAEGTITSYNTNGTPKTATITIDDDANGIGWFLDTTPGRRGNWGTARLLHCRSQQ
jgi:large repetitive protein